MTTESQTRRRLRVALVAALLGAVALLVWVIGTESLDVVAQAGVTLIALGYLIALHTIYRSGRTIPTRGGGIVSREINPIAYRVWFLLLSLFGLIPVLMIVFSVLPRATTPNPSIERTVAGKPAPAAHVER